MKSILITSLLVTSSGQRAHLFAHHVSTKGSLQPPPEDTSAFPTTIVETTYPSEDPTSSPTEQPSNLLSSPPSGLPSSPPSAWPTKNPTLRPTVTVKPSSTPSTSPTAAPPLSIRLLGPNVIVLPGCVQGSVERPNGGGDLDVTMSFTTLFPNPTLITFTPNPVTIALGDFEGDFEACFECSFNPTATLMAKADDLTAELDILLSPGSLCVKQRRDLQEGALMISDDKPKTLSSRTVPNLISYEEAQALTQLSRSLAGDSSDLYHPLPQLPLDEVSIHALEEAFSQISPVPIQEWVLRRIHVTTPHSIPLHRDQGMAIMEIKLAGQDDMLVVDTENGLEQPWWPVGAGILLESGVMHGLDVPHGEHVYLVGSAPTSA